VSGALELDLCIAHKRIGRLVRAIHTVNGEGMCGSCFRGQAIDASAGAPVKALERLGDYNLAITDNGIQAVAKNGGVKPMAERKNIDWNAVQRDRDAGMKITEMEKKYGVANPTIYAHTHGKNGAAKAKTRTNERTNERTKSPLEGQSERSWL
jgi:hypothetical protein